MLCPFRPEMNVHILGRIAHSQTILYRALPLNMVLSRSDFIVLSVFPKTQIPSYTNKRTFSVQVREMFIKYNEKGSIQNGWILLCAKKQ